MPFWKKKINSAEYKELKLQIELLWIEIDILTQRYKRKVKPKELPEETVGGEKLYHDGFDDLRNIKKPKEP